MSAVCVNALNAGAFNGKITPSCFVLKGPIMEQRRQTDKELVRQWLKAELAHRRPPPGPEQIRRELGWHMLKLKKGGIPREGAALR